MNILFLLLYVAQGRLGIIEQMHNSLDGVHYLLIRLFEAVFHKFTISTELGFIWMQLPPLPKTYLTIGSLRSSDDISKCYFLQWHKLMIG